MTLKSQNKWCKWQTECIDYNKFACMASSASGFVFECTYNENGKFVEYGLADTKRRKPIHPVGGGICEDYEPIGE